MSSSYVSFSVFSSKGIVLLVDVINESLSFLGKTFDGVEVVFSLLQFIPKIDIVKRNMDIVFKLI
jgi:hypothetical protein